MAIARELTGFIWDALRDLPCYQALPRHRRIRRMPDLLIVCVGGGSNVIGLFYPFLEDKGVRMEGVEGGGEGIRHGRHAARFQGGRLGVLQGCKTFLLADDDGQIGLTHSVSAGLDYAAVGPKHAFLRDAGCVEYDFATDDEALAAFVFGGTGDA